MKKKALIHVLSSVPETKEKNDSIEVVTPGNFYKKDRNYYAVYEETAISGMEGTTTTLKISEKNFSLIRMGSTSTKMDFALNKKNMSMYSTPYGTLEININTKKLDINIDDNGGSIYIDYIMSVAGQKPQNTILNINISPEKK
ncbi:TPA: DUF1934 domain-containing protein [Clostridium botulinum]|uniref:DUF1934 domain-containing protein n=1 Tax=Clostridium botulinum TaxID=1491 RepID=A0ABC8CTT7_CLOBO|nr:MULTISPECIES: DUF1934 domain-containing protein [Clostridium]AVQ37642.1 DUF1934 domain-containing protein [Clostridium botulinum]MBU5300900.1 DUF1934 domain-containing protein [Clostridium sporogenes]MCW6111470.1 DUF1934 domain-containing protein [Clostridium sporogenes]NFP92924.1 DUF1934 domain-containing protein [Clostridium sporogenes]HDK7157094.1 DUF1934 domain-containing protein [Clostridium botulinum]